MKGVCVQLLGVEEARNRVTLVLHECIWNVTAVSHVLLAFDHYRLPGLFSASSVLSPLVFTLVTVLHVRIGNRETGLKPTTFSTINSPCFPVFPLRLTPFPPAIYYF